LNRKTKLLFARLSTLLNKNLRMKKQPVFIFLMFIAPLLCFGFDKKTGAAQILVSDWLKVQQRLIRATTGLPHVAYSRHFAYTSIAVYEAMVSGDIKYRSLKGQLLNLETLPLPAKDVKYNWAASGNAAFAEMFRYFYKNFASNALIIDSMESAYHVKLQNADTDIGLSEVFGKSIALAVIAWAQQDGSVKSYPPFQPVTGEGKWATTPPSFGPASMPNWYNNRSMIRGETPVSLSEGPEAFSKESNSTFYKMVNEVYDVSRNLTEEQKNIAWFWDDAPNGKYISVFGHWASILSQLIEKENLSLMRSSEALVKMSISQYEATLACWRAKYKYGLLRPVSYIQKYIDPNWQPLIETPLHPEFPAAHATLSNAAATALTNIFGDQMSFVDHTYDRINMGSRKFASLEEAAREAGMSRLFGGIHYRPSIEAGHLLGQRCANAVITAITFSK
jgi:hypothetical protein